MAGLQRPIGEPPFPLDEPYDTATLTGLLAPRAHRVFRGDWSRRG